MSLLVVFFSSIASENGDDIDIEGTVRDRRQTSGVEETQITYQGTQRGGKKQKTLACAKLNPQPHISTFPL